MNIAPYKIFVMILSILFIAFICGCDQNRDIQIDNNSVTLEEESPFKNADINFIYTLSVDEVETMRTSEKLDEVMGEIKGIMMDQYGISTSIEFIPIKGCYETIKKRLNANDAIDVFTPNSSQIPGIRVPIINQKVLHHWISEFDIADLTEYVDKYYPELKKLVNDPYVRDTVMYNDKIYGIPGLRLGGDLTVLIVDKEYYRSMNNPEIKSINDLQELIKGTEDTSFKKGRTVICSFQDYLKWHCGNNETIYLENLLAYDDNTGNIISLADTEILKDAYDIYKDMAHLIDNIEIFTSLNIDKALILLIPYQLFKYFYTGSTYKFEDHFNFIYLNNPLTVTYDHFMLKCLINGSSNIEAALTFLRTMTYDEEVYDFFRYGIKDINYTVDIKGCVSLDKNIIYGWETDFKFLERSNERPFPFEMRASKDVFDQYLRNENYFMNQMDYRKIIRLAADHANDPEISQLLKKYDVQTLFNSPGEIKIHSFDDLFKTGMTFEEFKVYYDTVEMQVLIENLQSKLYN